MVSSFDGNLYSCLGSGLSPTSLANSKKNHILKYIDQKTHVKRHMLSLLVLPIFLAESFGLIVCSSTINNPYFFK